jgi:hypothetical protein
LSDESENNLVEKKVYRAIMTREEDEEETF